MSLIGLHHLVLAGVLFGATQARSVELAPVVNGHDASVQSRPWVLAIVPTGDDAEVPDGRLDALVRTMQHHRIPGGRLEVRLLPGHRRCPDVMAGADLRVCAAAGADHLTLQVRAAAQHIDLLLPDDRARYARVGEAAAWIRERVDRLVRRARGDVPFATFSPDARPGAEASLRVQADGPARLSVDNGPFRDLPVELNPDGRPHQLVLLFAGCRPLTRIQRFEPGTLMAGCAEGGGHRLTIHSRQPATRVMVRLTADDPWRLLGRIEPDEALSVHLPRRPFEVMCLTDGGLPWHRKWRAAIGQNLDVLCDPVPIDTVAIVTVDAAGGRLEVDGRRLARFEPADGGPPTLTMAAHREYRVVDLAPGPHYICASAPDRRAGCRGFRLEPGVGPARIELFLEPR